MGKKKKKKENQNNQELWHNLKICSIHIIGTLEGGGSSEKFPELLFPEVQRTQSRLNTKKIKIKRSQRYVIFKLQKSKSMIFAENRGKKNPSLYRNSYKNDSRLFSETMQVRRK